MLSTQPCGMLNFKLYVRKHWFEVATTADGTMKIYFDRQSRTGRQGGRRSDRWWLFTISGPEKYDTESLFTHCHRLNI